MSARSPRLAVAAAAPWFNPDGPAGLCVDRPNLFAPPDDGRLDRAEDRRRVQQARAVCHRCPLLEPCLRWSDSQPVEEQVGVIAGRSDEQRRLLARTRGQRVRRRTGKMS